MRQPWLLLVELSLFVLIAIASTWPLARHLATSVPLGTERVATVPLFTSWSVWWNCDRLGHLYSNYWDAPIFAGCADSFAFSEPLPLTVVAAPVYWLSDSPAAACNTLLILALTLNGWSAFRLLLRIHQRWLLAVLGGVMIELLPFVHHEIAVFQLVPLCGVIWTLDSLHRWMCRPALSHAVMTGVCCGVTYLLCSYYGLFLVLLLGLVVPCFLCRELRRGQTWCLVAACACSCLLVASPVVVTQLRVDRERNMARSRPNVQRFSAALSDYLVAPWPSVWSRDTAARVPTARLFSLYPGNVSVSLGILGTLLGLRYRRSRRWTAFCVAILVAALLLSLGPRLSIAGWTPYDPLADWIPGFAQARSLFRFGMFVQLMNAQLEVIGLGTLLRIARARFPNRGRRLLTAMIVAMGVAAAIELWPLPQRLFELPAQSNETAWIAWLRDQTPTDSVVACLPFPTGKSEQDYESTALWMYAATYHKRQLANGYSAYFPPSFLRLKATLASFPNDASTHALRASGVEFCVVERAAEMNEGLQDAVGWQRVFTDRRANVDIYQIRR